MNTPPDEQDAGLKYPAHEAVLLLQDFFVRKSTRWSKENISLIEDLAQEMSLGVLRCKRPHTLSFFKERALKRLLEVPSDSNIKGALLTDERIPLKDNSVDILTSLANFHHVPDKAGMFKEFGRVLRPGGRLVMGDIAHGTDVQRYFDGPVDRFCSTGHKHKFLNRVWAEQLCADAGLTEMSWEIADVPWVFESEAQAKRYIHLIHDIQCGPEEYLQEAKTFLGCTQNGTFKLNWQLFYLTAVKAISHAAPLH